MSEWEDSVATLGEQFSAWWLLVGVVLFVLLLSGPVGGVDLTGEPATLGDGNASVTVVEPTADQITVSEGRFGTAVSYVRLPDAVVEVERATGRASVVYLVTISGLKVEARTERYVDSTGRLRLPVADSAIPPDTDPGTYQGELTIRVKSFQTNTVVFSRSIEVTVE